MTIGNIFYVYEQGGRRNQEDFIWPPPATATKNDRIFIVCDGVGGLENGEIASKIISESVGRSLAESKIESLSADIVNQLLYNAREELKRYAVAQQLGRDMATTFTLLVLKEEKAFFAWCGDSRIYHFRNGQVLYKTEDHSLVNTLIKKGELSEREAQQHPQKHLILKAIKLNESEIDAEIHWVEEVQEGDVFLLCTDGLLENLSDEDLGSLILQHQCGEIELIDAIQRFCRNKTRDNYSMYFIETEKKPHQKPTSSRKRNSLLALFLLLGVGAILGYLFRANSALNFESAKAPGGKEAASSSAASTEVSSSTSNDSFQSISPSPSFYDSLEVIRKRALTPPKSSSKDSFKLKSKKKNDKKNTTEK